MLVKNVSQDEVRAAVRTVSEMFDGNVVLENIGQRSTNIVTFKLGAADSRGKGSRTSASGRRGKYACTHVFENVMAELIRRGGTVAIPKEMPGNGAGRQLNIENLRDLGQWAEVYNSTNIGSWAGPAYAEELCNEC